MTRVCPRCATLNTGQANMCVRCGLSFVATQPYSQFTSATNYRPAPQLQDNRPVPPIYPQFQEQPGLLPGPPGQPVRRRGTPRLFLVLFVLLLFIGGGYLAFTFLTHGSIPGVGSGQDPTAVLNQICHDIVTKNYQDAYQYESQRQKQQITEQQFVQFAQLGSSLGISVKTCTVSDVQVNGSTAIGKITATYTPPTTTYSSIYHMVLESDGWKVDSLSDQQYGQ